MPQKKEIQIFSPAIDASNRRCVYLMSFEDGSFYIGSTANLRQRISEYKSAFKNSIGSVNKLIAEKVMQYDSVSFFILEVVSSDANPKTREDWWMKHFEGHSFLLNRSKSAFNNAGLTKSNAHKKGNIQHNPG